jgi:hypothetical protein
MKINLRLVISGLLLLVFFASGCSTKKAALNRDRIVGTYTATFEGSTEILNLKPDGTYQLQRNSGKESQVVTSNEWNLVPYGDETKIALNGFPNPLNKGDQGHTSITLLGVEEKRTELRLYLSYDREWYYAKAR